MVVATTQSRDTSIAVDEIMGNDLDSIEEEQKQEQQEQSRHIIPLSGTETTIVSTLPTSSSLSPQFSRLNRSSSTSSSFRGRRRRRGMYYFIAGLTLLLAITYQALRSERVSFDGLFTSSSSPWGGNNASSSNRSGGGSFKGNSDGSSWGSKKNSQQDHPVPVTSIVPKELLGDNADDGSRNIYQFSDFINERGVVPTYWSSHFDITNATTAATTFSRIGNDLTTTKQASKTANAYEITNQVNHKDILSWGPCYPPLESSSNTKKTKKKRQRSSSSFISWSKEIQKAQELKPEYQYERNRIAVEEDGIYNKCRPGFIIIGAGKCGTSSLYHYLTDGHPRIIPAYSKQIHYFVYFAKRPLSWYYSHFPTTTNFLASGALMTGEASPGYLPYPEVARLMHQSLPDPKIIVVGRNPLERSWSSYKYNYVSPTIQEMKKGRVQNIPKRQSDEYYTKFLFSFEELIRAELTHLKACLGMGGNPNPINGRRNGFGINATRDLWSDKVWVKSEVENRLHTDTPLIDLDEVCYGDKVSSTVLREQWAQLQMEYPYKVMLETNVHLKQSLLGRSLYAFPLEWWYILYEPEQIHFVCTEELSDLSGNPLNEMAMDFLGLPFYNFSSTIAGGAFNVGGHRGYDKETSWTKVENEHKISSEAETTIAKTQGSTPTETKALESTSLEKNGDDHKNSTIVTSGSEIPLSKELLQELDEYLQPINERLFQLIGKRCDW